MLSTLPIEEPKAVSSTRSDRFSKSRVSVALVRCVPRSLPHCSLEFNAFNPIDVRAAQLQHQRYVNALKGLGLHVVSLPADERFPDCCYIEDTAVVVGDVAIITRPGTDSRRGEEDVTAEWLTDRLKVYRLKAPATLEGGDVLVVEKRIFVGLSTRTNKIGVRCLERILGPLGYEVMAVPVTGALHLKTACTYLGRKVMLAAAEYLPTFSAWGKGFDTIVVPRKELAAANAIAVEGTILVPAGFAGIAAQIKRRGFRVHALDISQHERAEAGLTCLSIRFHIDKKRLEASATSHGNPEKVKRGRKSRDSRGRMAA